VWADVNALGDRLTEAGAFVFQGGLISAESATVVRQSGDDFLITDGPYTETKEHLAGFWVINATDLDEALEWAKLTTAAQQRPTDGQPPNPGAWIVTTARNRAIDRVRLESVRDERHAQAHHPRSRRLR
jgi:hypothetical protein